MKPPMAVEAMTLRWQSIDDVVWLGPLTGGDFLAAHRQPDGAECKRSPRTLDVTSGTHHKIVSREPLTIAPSFLCDGCGLHGWIRDGHWTPA